MARRSPAGEPVKESFICSTVVIVLAIGIHALFGGFVIGVLSPKEGACADTLTEKMEDLVASLPAPTNVATISGAKSWGFLVLVITTACAGKIGGTVRASLLMRVPSNSADQATHIRRSALAKPEQRRRCYSREMGERADGRERNEPQERGDRSIQMKG
ncbi:hypothetical protein C2845_PM07G17930 [Panicum miliaceum]|uniref:Uncharacterized protein n=1 Tax=Panicum miliaceum TaxID=4540 RepID=A0A3L6SRH4_PANMI|nr:hypothetical protein C2845_PM07G17930 [Panicum miliaceum]